MYGKFIRDLLGPFLENFKTVSLGTDVGWANNGYIDVGLAVFRSEAKAKEALMVRIELFSKRYIIQLFMWENKMNI